MPSMIGSGGGGHQKEQPRSILSFLSVHTIRDPSVRFDCRGGVGYLMVAACLPGGAFRNFSRYRKYPLKWTGLRASLPIDALIKHSSLYNINGGRLDAVQ